MSLGQSSDLIPSSGAVISLNRWLEQVGVTPVTAWRWRRKGWLRTVNIAGRQYLTQEAIAEFHRRAVAGEFAQVHKVPSCKEVYPKLYADEETAFTDSREWLRKVFYQLRQGVEHEGKTYAIDAPYCIKVEFHESGWVHYHAVFLTRRFLPKELLAELWGLRGHWVLGIIIMLLKRKRTDGKY